jgi:hypothetical protein
VSIRARLWRTALTPAALSLLALVARSSPSVGAEPAANPTVIVVRAGDSDRDRTPIRLELPVARLGPDAARAIEGGPKALTLREIRDGSAVGEPIVAQVDRPGDEVSTGAAPATAVRLTFLLPGRTPAGAVRTFRVEPGSLATAKSPWTLSDPAAGFIDLKLGGRPVFRYNIAPVSHPDFPPIQVRNAYIHPAYTPSGALITADYSKHSHAHHRGFFLAYSKTQVGTLEPDFWNIHKGTGKVVFDRLDAAVAGPVTARLVTRHRWEATGLGTALRERWDVEAYNVPGTPYWMFDLTSTQQAAETPVVLPPYRYGGMTYRGADSFYQGPLDVLTSEGLDRQRGDQKPARWVDLTGLVAGGSGQYGGAVILDHPGNLHHPNAVRIHPTKIPFFVFTPAHDARVTLEPGKPVVFRYRVVIHDGHPGAALDERLWRDFAHPPEAAIEGEGR